ncbi:MAG: hypothetical protein IJH91_03240 [Mogibacterium sp.]|nr:hypothetical protein [Mogibacterium sp.]
MTAVGIARRMVVNSECRVFGNIWTKAALSEYDRFLLEDYGILAYQGPDFEVEDKLNIYLDSSVSILPGTSVGSIHADLSGYEMSNPRNFKKAISRNAAFTSIDGLLSGEGRSRRTGDGEPEDKVIRNQVVLDTLPSAGAGNSYAVAEIVAFLEEGSVREYVMSKVVGAAVEMNFIRHYFNSHLFVATDLPAYYTNEWEYVIGGKTSDSANLKICRRRIFLIRNALNYAYLSKDAEKQALLTGVAELITPGPASLVTKSLITEAWAAAEAEYDVQTLLDGKRVPLMKTDATWHTDINGLLRSKEITGHLDEESKELLEEHAGEISEMPAGHGAASEVLDGQTYEDYLLILLLAMNEDVRLLRMMDIVQINMKYRYYSDFNFEEYYDGVRFNVKVNGKYYEFEETYR